MAQSIVSSVVMSRHGDINEPWTNRSLYFGIYSISNDLKVLSLRTWAVSKFQLHCSSATVAYGVINVGKMEPLLYCFLSRKSVLIRKKQGK